MSMSGVICFIIILVIAESAIQGYRKGIIGIIIPILSCILAFAFSGKSTEILGTATEKISEPTSNVVQYIASEYKNNVSREGFEQFLPDESPLKKWIQDPENKMENEEVLPSDQQISIISNNAVVFSVTYLFFYIVLNIVLNIFTHTLVLGALNRIIGIVVGVMICIVKIWVLMILLEAICSRVPPLQELIDLLHSSALYNLIQSHNPILNR